MLWRIEYSRHLDDALSGEGARRYGGRWNRKGTAVVYLSSSLSLAALEKFVHAQPAGKDIALHALAIELPRDTLERALRPDPLPAGWSNPEPQQQTMKWGSEWAGAGKSLAALVPTALLPLACFERTEEFNLILNPQHPDMKKVRIADRAAYSFDPRMWKS